MPARLYCPLGFHDFCSVLPLRLLFRSAYVSLRVCFFLPVYASSSLVHRFSGVHGRHLHIQNSDFEIDEPQICFRGYLFFTIGYKYGCSGRPFQPQLYCRGRPFLASFLYVFVVVSLMCSPPFSPFLVHSTRRSHLSVFFAFLSECFHFVEFSRARQSCEHGCIRGDELRCDNQTSLTPRGLPSRVVFRPFSWDNGTIKMKARQ